MTSERAAGFGFAATARRSVARLTACALAALVVLAGASASRAQGGFAQDPVLFVHGIEGSGAQFESQKMRFMSNGYPSAWVDAVDYDSTRAVVDRSEVNSQIDQAIAALKDATGHSTVNVVGHSLGTSVMYDYLTEGSGAAERRANVGKYVNVDGQSSNPGVPTLAVWAGRGSPGRNMDGATNVTIPNQTHVQVATSAESFVEYHKFLTGEAPDHDIVPETDQITIAGRALLFPQNKGLPLVVTLEIWPVATDTGQRTSGSPVASIPLPASGNFGPVAVETGQRYEFVLHRPSIGTLHYYYEPFVRSDHLIRLLYADAIEALVQRSENHVAGLVLRYKELWGDQPGENDVLSLNGTNVCVEAICPISKQVNALFFYDRGLDGKTDLSSPDPVFSALPFITGADIFLPAARPPTGTVTASLKSRGGGPVRSLNFPNFPSTTDGAVLLFNDFEHVDEVPLPGHCDGGILGDDDPNVLTGTLGPDKIRGLGGADEIRGRTGRDCLAGDAGDDEIHGGGDPDELWGGDGDDEFFAVRGGHDVIHCGPGDDRVHAGRNDVVGASCERVTRGS